MASRPSRSGKDQKRHAQQISENVPVAWAQVRDLYPESIAAVVDDLSERGGISLRDLSAFVTAQLMHDLESQSDGADVGASITAHFRMLFRIALVNGGMGDASSVLVQVPEGLELHEPDDGDELL